MKLLNEKGHNIELHNLIIHKAIKAAGQRDVNVKLATKTLVLDKRELHFIADIREAFHKKSQPTYGIFDWNAEINIFHSALDSFLTDNCSFLQFTEKAMKFYEAQLKGSVPSSGAFIVFCDFLLKDNKHRYIVIFAINNKDGYNLSEELSIEQIKDLDLSKLDFAAMINITKWLKHKNEEDDVKTYLSFIKGKKNLAAYFLSFIGCADKSTAEDSSRGLIKALDAYFQEKGHTTQEKEEKRRSVFDYCDERLRLKQEILLSKISAIINPEEPTSFSEFASSEEFGVNEVIKGDKSILRSLQYVKFTSDEFSIQFKRSLLKDKRISYDSKKKQLLLKDLPMELINQLEEK